LQQVLETEMQQQPAPSQEEGVPPAAATAAREAQEPPVAEQPPPAPSTPTAAPLKTKMCAELELLLAMVNTAGPEIDLAVAMVHVSRAQLAVAAALGAASAELVDQTADEPTAADDDAPPADAPLPLGSDEFPDEALAVVCRFLGLRGLGRLACVARRGVAQMYAGRWRGRRFLCGSREARDVNFDDSSDDEPESADRTT
jgi:hypothetical protein